MEKAKAAKLQKKLSIPVVVLTHGKFATFDDRVYDSLRIAGTVLNRKKRAAQVIAFIERARRDLKRKSRKSSLRAVKQDPSVYIGGIGYKGGQGFESTDAAYVPFRWLGIENVATRTGRPGHVFVDKETLLKWNPDYIFIDGGGLPAVLLDRKRKPDYYRALKAVRQNQVYTLFPYNYYVTNISTAIVDAYFVGKVLYPQRFAAVDLEKKADAVYRFLVGKAVYTQMKRTYGTPRRIKLN
jgi:iron complex transport system substrate-binding protein